MNQNILKDVAIKLSINDNSKGKQLEMKCRVNLGLESENVML